VIEIVTPCNRQFYEDALDAMFRMRHRVFVEDKGWTLSSAGDGLERDAFDTAETVYFIWRGPNGAVHACARLNPTTGPHLLSGPFAAYCDLAPPPAGPDVHELSRFAVDRAAVGHERRREVRGRLDWAIACWCRRSRVGHVISFPTTEAYVARLRLWRTRPLGLPAPFDDGRTYIPAVSTVDEGLLTRLSAWYDFSEAMPACIRLCGGGLAEVYPDAAAAEA
jgi:acyl-homoserine lactone synthase